ncbi:MAG: hypothetical protein HY749_17775 [Gammaproteobacteria bacterium]|nr:hypothetical protein [Gammaproteobacteria bacterium]MBI5615931.1 hypothetical protein [Gammaproteobacteria bacterium]
MSVSSISSLNAALAATQSTRPEAREAPGPDHDGDADDTRVQNLQPPTQTVNASGQVVGTLLYATA